MLDRTLDGGCGRCAAVSARRLSEFLVARSLGSNKGERAACNLSQLCSAFHLRSPQTAASRPQATDCLWSLSALTGGDQVKEAARFPPLSPPLPPVSLCDLLREADQLIGRSFGRSVGRPSFLPSFLLCVRRNGISCLAVYN